MSQGWDGFGQFVFLIHFLSKTADFTIVSKTNILHAGI